MIPQTSYHLKQLGGGEVEQTNLDALKKKKKREKCSLLGEAGRKFSWKSFQ